MVRLREGRASLPENYFRVQRTGAAAGVPFSLAGTGTASGKCRELIQPASRGRREAEMPLLIVVTVVIQACFIYHVFKSGRPMFWAWIILGFPVVGCIAYYFVEVFPGSREDRSARKAARDIANALAPDRSLQQRIAEVETCGSVDNRLALADECAARSMHDEAIRLYRSCLSGAYDRDPRVLLSLARAELESDGLQDAAATLDRLHAVAPGHKSAEVKLLRARLLDGRGETDAALAAYRALVPGYVGFEARCRYAMLLERLGHRNQALAVFEDVLAQANRAAPGLESEQAWVALARRHATA
jgi:hypothetical protein